MQDTIFPNLIILLNSLRLLSAVFIRYAGYLTIAKWGEGIFGLEAVSQYHFGKTARQLSPMQFALLASCLPSPLRYNPARPEQHIRDRAS